MSISTRPKVLIMITSFLLMPTHLYFVANASCRFSILFVAQLFRSVPTRRRQNNQRENVVVSLHKKQNPNSLPSVAVLTL